jgi:hypothetical protein
MAALFPPLQQRQVMTELIFSPSEPNFESMTSDLARFEALSAEKRELESDIEKTMLDIDQMAMEGLKSAEEELQETNLKCAGLVARLERVAGGTLITLYSLIDISGCL